jgi:DNA-binding MarR family transcriptional regulator
MVSKQPKVTPDLALVHQAIACLGRLVDAFRRRREQLALSVGLTDGQWGVLEEISREHFMPSMFAKTRDSSAAAVSRTLRQLLDKDLISVTLSKSDGRQRDYVLTAKGQRIMQTLREERALAIEKIWLKFDPHLIKSFVSFGTQLSEHLEQYGDKSREEWRALPDSPHRGSSKEPSQGSLSKKPREEWRALPDSPHRGSSKEPSQGSF